MPINPFCIAPALLDEIKLTVEFRQKYDLHPTRLAVGLKQGLDMHKIWLIIKHSTATAIRLTLIGTLEFAVALFDFDSIISPHSCSITSIPLNRPAFGWPGSK